MLGIDLYQRYDLVTDWPQVRADGIEFCHVKLTNGAAVASTPGDAYVAGAKSAGIRVGGYHYALGGDPIAQGHVFASEMRRLSAFGVWPMLDFEDPSLPTDTSARHEWIVSFFAAVKSDIPMLTDALLYSSGSELTAMGATTMALPGLTVHIDEAEYGPNDGQEHPVVHYTGGPVAVHQYTSVGHLAGISTPTDLDDALVDITTGGSTMGVLQPDDIAAVADAVTEKLVWGVIANNHTPVGQTTPDGKPGSALFLFPDPLTGQPTRNLADELTEILRQAQQANAAIPAEQAALLAAISAQPTGAAVDIKALAAALAPLLGPTDAQALITELHAITTPPTTATP